MKFRIDKTLKIVPLVLIVIGILLALLLPWQCAKSQTAGSFNMTFDYSAAVDEQMREEYGPEWIKVEKDRIREGWQNRKSQARETFAQRRARVYNFDDVGGLSAADKKTLRDLYEKQRAFEAEQKRLADSAAAAQSHGAMIEQEEVPQQYAANIGKALSPRMLFTEAVPGTEGGGGGAPPPLAHGYIDGKGLATVVAVLVVGVVAVIATGYGLYHLGKWALRR